MSKLLVLLPVILPILAAPLIYLLPKKHEKAARALYFAVTLLNSALVAAVFFFPCADPFTIVDFGRDAGISLGLSFGADGAGRCFALLAALLWPPALVYAFGYMKNDEKQRVFYLFYTLSYGVTCGVAFSENLLTMYVFYEMLTLSTIPLVLHGYTREHRRAAIVYSVYSLGGAAFGFIGVAYLLYAAGSTDFVAGGLLSGAPDALGQVMFLLCFFGFGVKAAIFPLCGWLPTVTVAPTPVTALLHAMAVVKAGAFSLIRIVYFIFGAETLKNTVCLQIALGAALVTVLYGAVRALCTDHLKKRLAWSTVSNLSYIAAGVLLCSYAGCYAALFHIYAHAFAKISLFFCVGIFTTLTGRDRLTGLDGVGRKMPLTFLSYALAACSLVGIPLFFGFSSKWLLLSAAAQEGGVWFWLFAAAILIAALLTAIYCFSPVIRAFFPKKDKDLYIDSPRLKEDPKMLAPTLVLSSLTLLAGVFSAPLFDLFSKLFPL